MKATTVALLTICLSLSATTVSDSASKAVAALVPIPNAKPALGELALALTPAGGCALTFHGHDLIFVLPCDQIWEVRHAGFRDKWLSIGIASGSFATQYAFLLQAATGAPALHRLDIALPPDGSLETAEDFAQTLAARVRRPHTQAERPIAKVLFEAPAVYFAKKPGGIIATEGLRGGLVCSDTGFAFQFASIDHLSPERKAVIKNNAFAIPAAAVEDANIVTETHSGHVTNRPTILVRVRLRAGSPAYTEYHPLLTADNELLFRMDWVESSDRMRAYFQKLTAETGPR